MLERQQRAETDLVEAETKVRYVNWSEIKICLLKKLPVVCVITNNKHVNMCTHLISSLAEAWE